MMPNKFRFLRLYNNWMNLGSISWAKRHCYIDSSTCRSMELRLKRGNASHATVTKASIEFSWNGYRFVLQLSRNLEIPTQQCQCELDCNELCMLKVRRTVRVAAAQKYDNGRIEELSEKITDKLSQFPHVSLAGQFSYFTEIFFKVA